MKKQALWEEQASEMWGKEKGWENMVWLSDTAQAQ